MHCDLSNVHNLITPLLTLSRCGLKDRQTHLNVSLAENSLPYVYFSKIRKKYAIISKYLRKCEDTYFILQKKYLRIYKDTFGTKILRDDCTLKL